jgi:hypothetical protein
MPEARDMTAGEIREAIQAILPATRRLKKQALGSASPMAPAYFRNASELHDHLVRAAKDARLLDQSAFGKDADD